MDEKITFEKDNKVVKNLRHLQTNVFILFSPRQFKIEPATFRKIDTEVAAFLPADSKGSLTSIFREEEIMNFFMGNTVYG